MRPALGVALALLLAARQLLSDPRNLFLNALLRIQSQRHSPELEETVNDADELAAPVASTI